MKAKEKQILGQVGDFFGIALSEAEDEYSRFDAYNDDYIIEVKHRGKLYKRTLIEFDKYTFNKEYAKLQNKYFLYAVGFENEIYVFNISDLDQNGYNYCWEWRQMPKQTEFENRQDINKFVGYIDIDFNVGII